jgi:P pilus assembly chaperone PapD
MAHASARHLPLGFANALLPLPTMNIRQIFRFLPCPLLLALGMILVTPATASVVIGGTRVVYHGQARETTIKLRNEGEKPALTQAWIDVGDAGTSPAAISVPFILTPPVARIDPGKGQTLRIVYTGEPLPKDKESVFWLNVLDIPPKPSGEEASANRLQLVVRSRIKLFFRPADLPGSAQEAPEKVEWRLVQSNGQPALEARNPTPYHVSYALVEVVDGDKSDKCDDGGMVAPGETRLFPLKGQTATRATQARVHYHAISDYGGAIDGEAALRPN